MKTILHEIKNFRRLMKLNEEIETPVKVALIGDSLTNYLKSDDYINLPNMVNDDMTVDELIQVLSKEEPKVDVDHVFVSIGANDNFKNKKNIPFLAEYLNQIFPNANINIIKGIVGDEYFYGGEDETDFKALEDESKSFYDTFKQNGLDVLGSYNSIDYGLGFSDDKIKTLKKEIANSLFQNISNAELGMDPKKEDKPFTQKDNVDISGGDVTDFDTIYEFLERFEEMWNSGNVYDSRIGGSFKPDIEQIQLALNFLDPLYDIEITGKFDRDTEDAIYKYQKSVNLPETGVADSDTLEDMFFNLKIKGFDDEDLSIYLKNIDGYIDKTKKEINKFTGNVDSVWKSFTDKIIDNFEGGYWNRDKTKSNSEICLNHPWDDIYDNSGETMFGIDRRAGGWDNDPEGRQFFELIDNEKENAGSMESFCNTWTYNYGGGGLRDELKLRAAALMKNAYDDNSRFFSPATKREVESNKRLLFHFAYACWNGSGFFQRFANDINDAIEEGKTGNELVDVAIQSRNNAFGGTGWASANQEVVDIIKNDPDLEN